MKTKTGSHIYMYKADDFCSAGIQYQFEAGTEAGYERSRQEIQLQRRHQPFRSRE